MKLADLPDSLKPTGIETICLPNGVNIEVPKTFPTFALWRGKPITNARGGKPVINWNGEPLFAELVILRLLQSVGWEGVWVDTYGWRNRRSLADDVALPIKAGELLDRIRKRAEIIRRGRGGCFDVFAWREAQWLFAEAKQLNKDDINENQKLWLEAALANGIPVPSFLIVEWRPI